MPNNDDFRKSFASSKKSGAKTFTHQGKSYTTQTASEKAQGMTPKQKLDAYYKSYSNESSYHARTGSYSKSKAEVTRSYQDAAVKDPKAMEMDYKMRLDAYKKEKSYKGGGKMPLKKASGKGKGKRVKPV